MTQAEKGTKAAGETEKDSTAKSAEPSTRNKEESRSYQDLVYASQALFNVPGYVVAGAAVDAGLDINSDIPENEMRAHITKFLAKEAK